jgi:hypothetical protein
MLKVTYQKVMYLGGTWLGSMLQHELSKLRFCWASSVSPGDLHGRTFKESHDLFIPSHFQFTIHFQLLQLVQCYKALCIYKLYANF